MILASPGTPQSNFQKPPNAKIQPNAKDLITRIIPHINSVSVHCDGQPCREYDLNGTAFGAAQGTKRVLIDGVPCTGYLRWTATSITIGGPAMFWDHTYHFVIDDGAAALSNVFEARFLVKWDGATPNPAHAGDLITIHAWGAGAVQGAKVLKMGVTPMVVTSWSGSDSSVTIQARVPALPAGSYEIYLYNGAARISTVQPFRII
jgi:hypothetical protein